MQIHVCIKQFMVGGYFFLKRPQRKYIPSQNNQGVSHQNENVDIEKKARPDNCVETAVVSTQIISCSLCESCCLVLTQEKQLNEPKTGSEYEILISQHGCVSKSVPHFQGEPTGPAAQTKTTKNPRYARRSQPEHGLHSPTRSHYIGRVREGKSALKSLQCPLM